MAEPGRTTFETPNDLDILVTRQLRAPKQLVWRAFTEPDLIRRWLSGPPGWTLPLIEMDLRPGGKWRYGYRGAGGEEMILSGAYNEIVEHERIVSTESWGPQWPETVNTMSLEESDGVTTLRIRMTYTDKAARDRAMQTGVKEGMGAGLDRLAELLAGGE